MTSTPKHEHEHRHYPNSPLGPIVTKTTLTTATMTTYVHSSLAFPLPLAHKRVWYWCEVYEYALLHLQGCEYALKCISFGENLAFEIRVAKHGRRYSFNNISTLQWKTEQLCGVKLNQIFVGDMLGQSIAEQLHRGLMPSLFVCKSTE